MYVDILAANGKSLYNYVIKNPGFIIYYALAVKTNRLQTTGYLHHSQSSPLVVTNPVVGLTVASEHHWKLEGFVWFTDLVIKVQDVHTNLELKANVIGGMTLWTYVLFAI